MPIITRRHDEPVDGTVRTTAFTAEVEKIYRLSPHLGNFQVHLPTASGVGGQDIYLYVEYSGVNQVEVIPSGTEWVNSGTSLGLGTYESVILTSDGLDNWMTFGAPVDGLTTHSIEGGFHTAASGLTVGHVLTATSASTFNFAPPTDRTADELRNNSGVVDISSSPAPTGSGQVLVSLSATTAQWQAFCTASGMRLTSPDGNEWTLSINNAGALITTVI